MDEHQCREPDRPDGRRTVSRSTAAVAATRAYFSEHFLLPLVSAVWSTAVVVTNDEPLSCP